MPSQRPLHSDHLWAAEVPFVVWIVWMLKLWTSRDLNGVNREKPLIGLLREDSYWQMLRWHVVTCLLAASNKNLVVALFWHVPTMSRPSSRCRALKITGMLLTWRILAKHLAQHIAASRPRLCMDTLSGVLALNSTASSLSPKADTACNSFAWKCLSDGELGKYFQSLCHCFLGALKRSFSPWSHAVTLQPDLDVHAKLSHTKPKESTPSIDSKLGFLKNLTTKGHFYSLNDTRPSGLKRQKPSLKMSTMELLGERLGWRNTFCTSSRQAFSLVKRCSSEWDAKILREEVL